MIFVESRENLHAALTKHSSWGDGGYLVKETAVYCESGVNYPDGGHSETASVDICPKCFKEKLMPWLQSQGANVRREELIY